MRAKDRSTGAAQRRTVVDAFRQRDDTRAETMRETRWAAALHNVHATAKDWRNVRYCLHTRREYLQTRVCTPAISERDVRRLPTSSNMRLNRVATASQANRTRQKHRVNALLIQADPENLTHRIISAIKR